MRQDKLNAFVPPSAVATTRDLQHRLCNQNNTQFICRSWTFRSSLTPSVTFSFHNGPSQHQQRRAYGAICQLGSPSTQIGRPKTSIKKDIGRVTQQPDQPQADAEKGSAKARPRRKTQADEVPLYKVILLGDEEYVEAHVVTQIQKTVQLDKGEATRIFREAQTTGSSIICVVCEEHAEFYAQQLRRQDIFVVVEKDE